LIWERRSLTKNDLDTDDLTLVIQRTNEAIKKNPDLSSELSDLRRKLEIMKVSTNELESLRDDYERGNITTENYHVQSKKLRMDIERARDEANLISIINKVQDGEKKSKLLRIKEAILSNKDFIVAVVEILGAIMVSGRQG
jgi:exopolysaccharide biosynthesis predicted pyruvyltransferase EpsI